MPATAKDEKKAREKAAKRPLPRADALSPQAPLLAHAAAPTAAQWTAEAEAEAAFAEQAQLAGAANSAAATKQQRPGPDHPIALEAVLLRQSTVVLEVFDDPHPRRVEGVSAKLRLSAGHRKIEVDVGGRVRQRDPNGRRCTMLTVTKRHLRETVSAAERALEAAEAARGGDGGSIRVLVTVGQIGVDGRWPELLVRVIGKNLHAAVVENLLDLPMDINGGRLDGELRVRAFDEASWDFPELGGSVRARGCGFHFHDAVDDFAGVDTDLLFEGNRLYLHGAHGFYGAIPLTATGDIDILPDTGEYHLSAQIDGVEANSLRETLGARPTPRPVAGALRGFLHCTGPLEKPLFMGTAVRLRPPFSAECLPPYRTPQSRTRSLERTRKARLTVAHFFSVFSFQVVIRDPDAATRPIPSGQCGWAAEAVLRDLDQGAVAAYDRIPFAGAKAVWTLDTASNVFRLHEVDARPVGGGRLRGSGFMRVDAEAEFDPSAMRVELSGTDLDADGLLRRYEAAARELGVDVPPQLMAATLPIGAASVEASLIGSLMTPTVDVRWAAPQAEASGTLQFTRPAITVGVKTPGLDVSGTIDTVYPPIEQALAARSQEESMVSAEFVVAGIDADVQLHNLDVLGLVQASGLVVVCRAVC